MKILYIVSLLILLGVVGIRPSQAENSWTSKTPMTTERLDSVSGVVNGKIYVIGGWIPPQGAKTNKVEVYDPATENWTEETSLPDSVVHTACGVVDGKIYVIGGQWDSNPMTAGFVYDPLIGNWSSIPPMPTARYGHNIGVVNGKIYVIGGYNSSANEMYDPQTGQWTSLAPMPTTWRDHLGVAVVNNKIYAIGGRHGFNSDPLGLNEEYDPATGNWTTMAPMLTARAGFYELAVVDNKIYVMGGENGITDSVYSENEMYDPAADSWTAMAPLPTPRHGMSIQVVNNKIYTIGGGKLAYYDWSNINEEYTPISTPVNQPPDISAIPDTLNKTEGETITAFEIELATDPDGDTLTYTYSGWLTSLPHTTTNADIGTHTLHVDVSDGVNPSVGKDITVTVALVANAWFVRPAGGNYGTENGTSYENAWDGLLNVVWGPGGVEAGDTLYVCGLHVHDVTNRGNIATQADITPVSGTSESARVTIRGDYPGDQGIVWGAYRMSYDTWTDEGDGVWSIPLPGNSKGDWYFQDIGNPTNEDFVVLDKENNIEGVRNHPGSHYSVDYKTNSLLYVKLTDGGNPTSRIYANRWGYDWGINGLQYITFLNLKFYNPYRFLWGESANHIRWEGCTLAYGEHSLVSLFDNSDYMEVINCELSWASNGIYTISGTNNAPSNYLFKGNYIHDIGVRESTQNSDAHGIGIQGGHDGVIEDNIIENCGSGPLLYAFTNQELKNTIVRRNLIKDLHNLGGATGYGIATQCNNNASADKSGIKIYQNIVINASVGGRFHYEQEQEVYNNIFYKCNVGFASGRNYNGLGANIKLRNNIFLNSTVYHISWYTGASVYTLDSDYNLFYPTDGDLFRLGAHELSFTDWQALSKTGRTFDPNSIVADPLFVDPDNGNFHLRSGSPAIDAGIDVGLTQDFEGNPVPQGNAPDIGAYEYVFFPVSVIRNEPKEGHAPLTVSFDGSQSTSPNGNIVSYEWDFGDGSTSIRMKTSHIFTSAGEYTVTLTVTDDHGWKGKSQTHITVFEKEFGELPAGCYNNVFNPAKGEKVLIVVELPKQAHVKISLYNTRGNRIRELADEEKEAGIHKYYWDGRNDSGNVVGSGLYFVHIQAGDYKKTKKIVVVK